MARARPSPGDAGDRDGGVTPWLVLDLTGAEPTWDLIDALAELSQAVAGVTVLVDGHHPTGVGDALVVEAGDRGSAARLRRAGAGVPDHVDVLVHGDEQLLAADYRCSVRDALALLDDADVALVRGVPVTDSLRRVDHRRRLTECVDRDRLFVLRPPLVIRREAVATIAEAACSDGADGSVEAGLMRAPSPVRVVDLYPTATGRARASAVPTGS